MMDSLMAEWVKLRSVRSTYLVLGVVVVVVLLAAYMTWNGMSGWDRMSAEARARVRFPPPGERVMLPVVQLATAVLGALAFTSETATGMIRTSFTAMPRRRVVLGAKALVVAVVALAAGQAFAFATFLATRAIIGDRPIPGFTAPIGAEAPMLISLGLSVAVVAVLGLGLAAATRSTVVTIVSVAALLLVVPGIAAFLPEPVGPTLSALMLTNLPDQLAGADSAEVSRPVAIAALTAWVVAALTPAMVLVGRRDAG
jgi:hypothetical protein